MRCVSRGIPIADFSSRRNGIRVVNAATTQRSVQSSKSYGFPYRAPVTRLNKDITLDFHPVTYS